MDWASMAGIVGGGAASVVGTLLLGIGSRILSELRALTLSVQETNLKIAIYSERTDSHSVRISRLEAALERRLDGLSQS